MTNEEENQFKENFVMVFNGTGDLNSKTVGWVEFIGIKTENLKIYRMKNVKNSAEIQSSKLV